MAKDRRDAPQENVCTSSSQEVLQLSHSSLKASASDIWLLIDSEVTLSCVLYVVRCVCGLPVLVLVVRYVDTR